MVGDLVYTAPDGTELGVLSGYSLDAAWGADENDFELKMGASPALACGSRIYFDGTEIGGIVDGRKVDETGDAPEVTYRGRTWHGILAGKVVCPDPGASHLAYSGDANAVLRTLVARVGCSDVFEVPDEAAGEVGGEFIRFGNAWECILLMLAQHGMRPDIVKVPAGGVRLRAVPQSDYSGDFYSDQYAFEADQEMRHVNHLVCLGDGELDARSVLHLYADEVGDVRATQSLTGAAERTEVYEASSAPDKLDAVLYAQEVPDISGGTATGLDQDHVRRTYGSVFRAGPADRFETGRYAWDAGLGRWRRAGAGDDETYLRCKVGYDSDVDTDTDAGKAEALELAGRQRLLELQEAGEVDITVPEGIPVHVGDIVGATSVGTGIRAVDTANKVIVSIDGPAASWSYETGGLVEEREEIE